MQENNKQDLNLHQLQVVESSPYFQSKTESNTNWNPLAP